jgi:hypothetical protein
MLPTPKERELDVWVGREIFGLTVAMLPAWREPECGSVQIYEPWWEEDIRKRGVKWELDKLDYCSSRPMGPNHETGFWGGIIPTMRLKKEGATGDTEDDHWYDELPRYSTSLDEAWKVVLEVRKWRADIAKEVWDKFVPFVVFMQENNLAEKICQWALKAKESTPFK